MEPSRKVPRLTANEEKDKDALDAEVWSKLQLPLFVIYEKLSQEELSRLRLVCKEWNHAALQRLLPKPYFVTITLGFQFNLLDQHYARKGYLNEIVSYDVASGQCSFKHQRTRLHNLKSHVRPFEVEGLILCHMSRNDLKERGVFNVHTQTWHAIPPAPVTSKKQLRSACGLMVDTSNKPYAFKLIEGNTGFNTQIYDSKSRSWSSTSSRLIQAASSELNKTTHDDTSYSCVCSYGHVYISIGVVMILTYSMEEDTWTKLDFPAKSLQGRMVHCFGYYIGEHNTMGVWEGRIFTTTENCLEKRVSVWELVDPKEHKWVEYARMSKEQYLWVYENNPLSTPSGLPTERRLLSCFCDGYLLVCGWQWNIARAAALVLLDMAKMKWKEVDLPMGTMATYHSYTDGDEIQPFSGPFSLLERMFRFRN